MNLLEKSYRALKGAGLDVRLANEHMGKCAAPYVVVYEGAQESAGRTIGYRHILIDVLAPKNAAARLSAVAAEARAAMIGAGLSLSYATSATTLDDYDAISVTYDYRALCAL